MLLRSCMSKFEQHLFLINERKSKIKDRYIVHTTYTA
jgi:hypothetical protein